jgi:hypothetical protein
LSVGGGRGMGYYGVGGGVNVSSRCCSGWCSSQE